MQSDDYYFLYAPGITIKNDRNLTDFAFFRDDLFSGIL